ncbi:MAG: twin-arginine translocase subunit TatC [Bacteroidales bacterium]|nr:twin-arginine translocase subunit TatC [Bacteroidales bacterium]
MTMGGHLEVFRRMLFRIAGVVLAMGIAIFCFKDETFNLLLAPHTNDFITFKWVEQLMGLIGIDFTFDAYNVPLISTELAAQFMTHISTSCYLAFLFASPYLLFELFRFVSPALYENEKRYSIIVVFVVYVLFLMGLLMSYFVIFPVSFQFLATYQVDPTINNTITLSSYISTFTTLTLMMGIVFQLPVIAFVLAKMGIVDTNLLRHYRRHALVIITIIAAIITPTTDIFTLLLVTGPIYLLYELSIMVVGRVAKD